MFVRVYRLETQSVMLVFSTQLCELLASNLLSGSLLLKRSFFCQLAVNPLTGRRSHCIFLYSVNLSSKSVAFSGRTFFNFSQWSFFVQRCRIQTRDNLRCLHVYDRYLPYVIMFKEVSIGLKRYILIKGNLEMFYAVNMCAKRHGTDSYTYTNVKVRFVPIKSFL